jgi:hypothetical protein
VIETHERIVNEKNGVIIYGVEELEIPAEWNAKGQMVKEPVFRRQ